MKVIILAALAVALAGCAVSGASYGPQAVAGLQGLYIAAVSSEVVYERSGAANPAIVAKIEADRKQAYAALQPLTAAAASGHSVATAAEFEAASLAITAYSNALAANHITPGA